MRDLRVSSGSLRIRGIADFFVRTLLYRWWICAFHAANRDDEDLFGSDRTDDDRFKGNYHW